MTLRHHLAAVWFADIVDYSDLTARDEARALRLVDAFQSATREAVERFGGRIVKFLGDGAMAEFPSTRAAVGAAEAVRKRFRERAVSDDLAEPSLRIGIHVGDVAIDRGGDLYGDGVNVAARLRAVAEPGETLASEDVFHQLRQRHELEFEPRGTSEFKGVGPIDVYAVRAVQEIPPEVEEPVREEKKELPLWKELGRRHVFRVAVVYAIVAWLLVQIANATFEPLHLPGWALTLVVVLVIAGFPIAILLAWAFEVTPSGVQRTPIVRGSGKDRGLGARGRIVAGAAIALAVVMGLAVVRWSPWGESPGVSDPSPASASATLDPSRLAVLYFESLSEEAELGPLADGITETLIHTLGGIDEIEVVSRHGVRPYRDAEVSLDSIARTLGAGVLVEGSVDRAGDSLRVQVRMIDAMERTRIAGFTEVAPWSEIFSLQEELASDISAALRQRLGRELRLKKRRRSTDSVEAWELVQRAERLVDQLSGARGDSRVSVALQNEIDALLQRAESLDSDWIEPALVRGELAATVASDMALRQGLEWLDGALDAHPRNPRALALRGVLRDSLASSAADSIGVAEHLAGAERDLRTAVGFDPSLAKAWIGLADLLYNDKWRLPEAMEAAKKAYEMDAFLLEEDHFRWACEIALQLKEVDEAGRWCAEGRRRYPDQPALFQVELARLASPGVEPDPVRAWQFVEKLSRLGDAEFNVPPGMMYTAAVLARAGLRDSADAVVAEVRRRQPSADVVPYLDYLEAYVRLLLDERSESLELLGSFLRALPSARAQIARDWWFEDLAGDPRFEALVDRKRLPIFCRILCEPPGSS